MSFIITFTLPSCLLRKLVVSLFLIVLALPVFSQQNVIKLDVFGWAIKRKNICIEHTFKQKFSIGLSYENQIYASGERNGAVIYEVKGKGLIPEFRYYPLNKKKPAPLGFYFPKIKSVEK